MIKLSRNYEKVQKEMTHDKAIACAEDISLF